MSVSVTQVKQFIGGEWVESSSGETMEVLNPATGEAIAEAPRATAEDVDRAVEAAKKAWASGGRRRRRTAWSCCSRSPTRSTSTPTSSRGSSRRTWASRCGSPRTSPALSDNLRFFAGAARNLEGKSAGEYVEGYTSLIRREPLGIVAGIAPWNYPL